MNVGEITVMFYKAVFEELMALLEMKDYETLKKIIKAMLKELGEVYEV